MVIHDLGTYLRKRGQERVSEREKKKTTPRKDSVMEGREREGGERDSGGERESEGKGESGE